MKKVLSIFLQIIIVLFGIAVLVFMLWEPHLEGRNVNATLFQIYFNDPFLAYIYASSIVFFVVIYQAVKFLGNIGRGETFSNSSVNAVRIVGKCAIIFALLIVGAEAWIIISQSGKDDIAGGVAVGLFIIVISAVVAITSRIIEKRLVV